MSWGCSKGSRAPGRSAATPTSRSLPTRSGRCCSRRLGRPAAPTVSRIDSSCSPTAPTRAPPRRSSPKAPSRHGRQARHRRVRRRLGRARRVAQGPHGPHDAAVRRRLRRACRCSCSPASCATARRPRSKARRSSPRARTCCSRRVRSATAACSPGGTSPWRRSSSSCSASPRGVPGRHHHHRAAGRAPRPRAPAPPRRARVRRGVGAGTAVGGRSARHRAHRGRAAATAHLTGGVDMAKFTRGFTGRGKAAHDPRLPPGQYDAGDSGRCSSPRSPPTSTGRLDVHRRGPRRAAHHVDVGRDPRAPAVDVRRATSTASRRGRSSA